MVEVSRWDVEMAGTTNDALPALGAGSFTLDLSASVVGFSTKNFLGQTVRGEFPAFRTVVDVAANPAESATKTTVSVASVDTKSKMRDRDLQEVLR
jgi:polyisoprenoid-binding protein YceI